MEQLRTPCTTEQQKRRNILENHPTKIANPVKPQETDGNLRTPMKTYGILWTKQTSEETINNQQETYSKSWKT